MVEILSASANSLRHEIKGKAERGEMKSLQSLLPAAKNICSIKLAYIGRRLNL